MLVTTSTAIEVVTGASNHASTGRFASDRKGSGSVDWPAPRPRLREKQRNLRPKLQLPAVPSPTLGCGGSEVFWLRGSASLDDPALVRPCDDLDASYRVAGVVFLALGASHRG